MAEEAISYINNHFQETVTVEDLAVRVGLSQYHFIRTFKNETGFTPQDICKAPGKLYHYNLPGAVFLIHRKGQL